MESVAVDSRLEWMRIIKANYKENYQTFALIV